MMNDDFVLLLNNYNEKISLKIHKIFTDKSQFKNNLKTLEQYKDMPEEELNKIIDNLSGSFYMYENIFGPIGLDLDRCLVRILFFNSDDIILKIIHKYDKEYISYSDFIKREQENSDNEETTLRKIKNKYPDLFISKIWFYKYVDNKPTIKGAYDILKEYILNKG